MSDSESESEDDMTVGEISCKHDFNSKWTTTWTIWNFSTQVNHVLKSPRFPRKFQTPTRWTLHLYPKSVDAEDHKDYLKIYIRPERNVDLEFYIDFVILDNKMNEVHTFSVNKNFNGIRSWGSPQFVERSYILDGTNCILTAADNLVIKCEISCSEFNNKVNNSNPDFDRLKEFDYFEKLLGNELFADLTISIDDQKIPAHKNILSSRSSVFCAMFQHDMEENHSNTVIIEDIKYTVMYELLRFVYAGKVDNIDTIAAELLAAANKYDIQGLKTLCEESLYDTLNTENAIEYLQLADIHETTKLKYLIIGYITENSKIIVKLPNFKFIEKLSSSLLAKLLRIIYEKQ